MRSPERIVAKEKPIIKAPVACEIRIVRRIVKILVYKRSIETLQKLRLVAHRSWIGIMIFVTLSVKKG